MKRLAVLLMLLLVGALSLLAAQQQGQPAKLDIQKVKDNLFMITGGGGNTAAFITDKVVVVVDTKLPNNGPGILEKIKSVTNKPVTMVINTHTHGDHVGSNSAFTGTVEFVAQENCKASMEKMPAFQSAEGKKFLPSKTYKDKLSLLKGKDKIDLYYSFQAISPRRPTRSKKEKPLNLPLPLFVLFHTRVFVSSWFIFLISTTSVAATPAAIRSSSSRR